MLRLTCDFSVADTAGSLGRQHLYQQNLGRGVGHLCAGNPRYGGRIFEQHEICFACVERTVGGVARQAGCILRILGTSNQAGVSRNDTTIPDTVHSVTYDRKGLFSFAIPDKLAPGHASPLRIEVSQGVASYPLVQSQHGLSPTSVHVKQQRDQRFPIGEQARPRQQQEEILGRRGCRSAGEACLQGTSARTAGHIFDAEHEPAPRSSTVAYSKPHTEHRTSRTTSDTVAVPLGCILDAASRDALSASTGARNASHVDRLCTSDDFLGSREQWIVTTEHAIRPGSHYTDLALSSHIELNLRHSHETPQPDQHTWRHRELQRIFAPSRSISPQRFRNAHLSLSFSLPAAA